MNAERAADAPRIGRWYAALILFVAAFQAWSLHKTVAPILDGEPAQATFRIEAAAPNGDPASRVEIWISKIWLDGRIFDPRRHGNDRPGYSTAQAWDDYSLHFLGPAAEFGIDLVGQSLVLEVLGRRTDANAVLPRLVATRDGAEPVHVDIAATAGATPVRLYTYPPPTRHRVDVPLRSRVDWFLPAAFGGLLLIGFALRPWRSHGRGYLLVHLLLMHGMVWWTLPGDYHGDSFGYVTDARNGLNGFAPSYFPQGLPLVIWLLDLLPGPLTLGTKITLANHVMVVTALLWLHRILLGVMPPFIALAAAVAAGSTATTLLYPQSVGTESLAMFGILGCLYFSLRARDTGGLGVAIAAGVLGGLATLARVSPLAVVGPMLLLPLTAGLRVGLRPTLIGLGALALSIAPFLVVYKVKHDVVGLSDSGPGHMFNRVVYGQGLLDRDGAATQELLARLASVGADPRGQEHMVTREILCRTGLGHREALALQGRVAMEAIQRHPAEFLRGTLSNFVESVFLAPAPSLRPLPAKHAPADSIPTPPGATSAGAITWVGKLGKLEATLWPVIASLSVLGAAIALLRRRRAALVMLAFAGFGLIFAAVLGENVYPRYGATSAPMLIALAVFAFLLPLVGTADDPPPHTIDLDPEPDRDRDRDREPEAEILRL